MKTFSLRGDIVSDEMVWIYNWFEEPCCSPSMIRDFINSLEDGEEVTIEINSPGGDVQAGSEIYSILSKCRDKVTVEIQSMAASAASFIAMAGGTVKISPVAMMMIHNCSCSACGDYNTMLHTAGVLQTVNEAIANAYEIKTGKSKEELLDLMNKETWLSANDCLKYGFVDEIIKPEDDSVITNAVIGSLSITPEMIEKAKEEKSKIEDSKNEIMRDLYKYGI